MSDAQGRRRSSSGAEPPDPMFAALLDGTSDAVFVVSEAGHLVHANRQALDRLGYTEDDLLQLRRAGVFARGTDENVLVCYCQPGHTGRDQSCRCLLLHRDGSTIPVTLTVRRVERESRLFFLCIARDHAEP